MIKATELRIGSFVEPITKSPCKVTGILHQRVSDGDVVFIYADGDAFLQEHIAALALTEDWLLKFGFKKEEKTAHEGHYFYSMWWMDYKYSFAYAPFRKDWGFYHSYTDSPDPKDDNKFDFISCEIKYVHHLQNLIFALTGTELTI